MGWEAVEEKCNDSQAGSVVRSTELKWEASSSVRRSSVIRSRDRPRRRSQAEVSEFDNLYCLKSRLVAGHDFRKKKTKQLGIEDIEDKRWKLDHGLALRR